MKRNQTDRVVLWMRLRSIPQRSFRRVTCVPHVTEVLRQEVRRFTLHRRTGHIPDFLSGIELRTHGRDLQAPG
jgi:hypothetical protein